MSATTPVVVILCAILFFRIASMERRSGLIWSAASVAVSAACIFVIQLHFVLGQFLLFCVMWYLNYIRPDKKIDV